MDARPHVIETSSAAWHPASTLCGRSGPSPSHWLIHSRTHAFHAHNLRTEAQAKMKYSAGRDGERRRYRELSWCEGTAWKRWPTECVFKSAERYPTWIRVTTQLSTPASLTLTASENVCWHLETSARAWLRGQTRRWHAESSQ